jgi:hypothetical protein
VDLAHATHRQRRRVRALAHRGVVERLDVDDDVAPGKCSLDGGLDSVGGRVPLAHRGARRNADHDVCELATARRSHP